MVQPWLALFSGSPSCYDVKTVPSEFKEIGTGVGWWGGTGVNMQYHIKGLRAMEQGYSISMHSCTSVIHLTDSTGKTIS